MEPKNNTVVAIRSAKLLPALASFVAVATTGSFTRAARVSGSDKTVMSRRVSRLEEALQLQLFHRTTRSLRLTEAGQRLLDQVAEPLSEVLLGMATSTAQSAAQGEVRVATISSLTSVWIPVARELQRRHPQVTLNLSSDIAFRNLVDEGFDLAVRAGHLPDSSMVAQQVATWRFVLVAAPEWLESRGAAPTHPDDVTDSWVLFPQVAHADRWTFQSGDREVTIRARATLHVDDPFLLREAVAGGLGIAALPPYLVEDDLESGRLVRLLPEWNVAHVLPIWLIRPHRAFVPARVQAVMDVVEEVAGASAARWASWSD